MAEPFVGEIRVAAFGIIPRGWVPCDGRLLQITSNQALYALLGTRYGGDGRTTFGIPQLQGRTPMNTGTGFALAQSGGEATHLLTTNEMPSHRHSPQARAAVGSDATPAGNTWGQQPTALSYATEPSSLTLMSSQSILPFGGGLAHDNESPYLVLNFIMATVGIFPPRS
jgi:microcystin-dependent protein